jgi:hypothetical protein
VNGRFMQLSAAGEACNGGTNIGFVKSLSLIQ